MLNIRKSIVIGLAALSLAGVSQAAIYTDVDLIGERLTSRNPTYVGNFDITGPGWGKGFVPGSDVIDSACIEFLLGDLDFAQEKVTVDIEGDIFSGSGYLVTIVLGTLSGSLSILNDSGVLEYVVTLSGGRDIYLGSAKLIASGQAVPDSASTLTLLGLGLLGLTVLRRRFAV